MIALATDEIRDMIFSKVQERALRLVSVSVLKHLHALSLRFHLERQTGGLSRAIERGPRASSSWCPISCSTSRRSCSRSCWWRPCLWTYFNFGFAAVTFLVVIFYGAYTAGATQWRLKFRRAMNAQDSEANARPIDSLLNFETVKYFSNEKHELERFDQAKRELRDGGRSPISARCRCSTSASRSSSPSASSSSC